MAEGNGTDVSGGDERGASNGRDGARVGPRLPSGLRGTGVTIEEARAKAYRPTPEQTLTEPPVPTDKFEHAQFVAHLKGDLKFVRSGDVELTLTIPYEFVPLALPLYRAFGLPLSVDIQLWRPYAESEG